MRLSSLLLLPLLLLGASALASVQCPEGKHEVCESYPKPPLICNLDEEEISAAAAHLEISSTSEKFSALIAPLKCAQFGTICDDLGSDVAEQWICERWNEVAAQPDPGDLQSAAELHYSSLGGPPFVTDDAGVGELLKCPEPPFHGAPSAGGGTLSKSPSTQIWTWLTGCLQPGSAAGVQGRGQTSAEAKTADATIIAMANNWTVADVEQMMDDQQAFGELAADMSSSYPDAFSSGAFAGTPTGSSQLYFKGGIPSTVPSMISSSGLAVDLFTNTGKNYVEWADQQDDLADFLEEQGIADYVVAFDLVDTIEILIGSGATVPTLPVDLVDDVFISGVSVTLLVHQAAVRGGSKLFDGPSRVCTSSSGLH